MYEWILSASLENKRWIDWSSILSFFNGLKLHWRCICYYGLGITDNWRLHYPTGICLNLFLSSTFFINSICRCCLPFKESVNLRACLQFAICSIYIYILSIVSFTFKSLALGRLTHWSQIRIRKIILCFHFDVCQYVIRKRAEKCSYYCKIIYWWYHQWWTRFARIRMHKSTINTDPRR